VRIEISAKCCIGFAPENVDGAQLGRPLSRRLTSTSRPSRALEPASASRSPIGKLPGNEQLRTADETYDNIIGPAGAAASGKQNDVAGGQRMNCVGPSKAPNSALLRLSRRLAVHAKFRLAFATSGHITRLRIRQEKTRCHACNCITRLSGGKRRQQAAPDAGGRGACRHRAVYNLFAQDASSAFGYFGMNRPQGLWSFQWLRL